MDLLGWLCSFASSTSWDSQIRFHPHSLHSRVPCKKSGPVQHCLDPPGFQNLGAGLYDPVSTCVLHACLEKKMAPRGIYIVDVAAEFPCRIKMSVASPFSILVLCRGGRSSLAQDLGAPGSLWQGSSVVFEDQEAERRLGYKP